MDVGTDKNLVFDCWRSNFGHLTVRGKLVNFTSIFPQRKRKHKKYRQKMVVLLVIYKPLYWPIARSYFSIATRCTDKQLMPVHTYNQSLFYAFVICRPVSVFSACFKSWLNGYWLRFFFLLRPEWITVDIVYSVHWSSVHTILDNRSVPTRKQYRIGRFSSHIRTVISVWFL